jgi:hypothetical protein
MPRFETLSLEEAKRRAAPPTPLAQQYRQYIMSLGPDQAGHLTLASGETMRGVRVRLARAARLAGKTLTVRAIGDDLYFWPAEPVKRRRGPGRKNTLS